MDLVLSCLATAIQYVVQDFLSKQRKLYKTLCAFLCQNVVPFIKKHNILNMNAGRWLYLTPLCTETQRTEYKVSFRDTEIGQISTLKRTASFKGCFKYSAAKIWTDLPRLLH